MSFPVNVGQIPISYNELPTGRPYDPQQVHLQVPGRAQRAAYPFGYGLSYTTFSLRTCACHRQRVRNGPADGDAPTLPTRSGRCRRRAAYLHESDTSFCSRCASSRVSAGEPQPGQSKTVKFTLDRQNLGFYNNNGKFVVEPGPFDVWVGDSSDGGLHETFTLR